MSTNDDETVIRQFGRKRYLMVLTMEDGPGPARVGADGDILLAGGVGSDTPADLKRLGVEPMFTEMRSAEEAAFRRSRGDLPDLEERPHDGTYETEVQGD